MNEAATLLIQLGVMAVFGTIVALIAHHKGRSAVGWFFVGCFGGCIGLILVLVLPDLNAEQERERKLANENRRLKEQLRKDRMVADSRQVELDRRLQVHDTALGVDTAPVGRQLPGAQRSGPAPQALQWWYVQDGRRQGPVAFSKLQELWNVGTVDANTVVWATGMAQWTPIGDVAALFEALCG